MSYSRVWTAVMVLALMVVPVRPDAQQAGVAGTAQSNAQMLRQFSGAPIDVDYQTANLRTVLRQLSEIGGINLVIDPSVPTAASVDLKLTQVPWDQVMDVVLKTSGLTSQIEGVVLRVMTMEARTAELEAAARQKQASQQAPDLETARLRLSYSPAASVKALLEQARVVSERGTVEIDERTNMVIIKDLPERIAEVEQLIGELDRPEPQVEIQARIVQTNRDTAQALGVQWGFNGRMTPELGNTTNLAFPNNGTLSGRVTEQGLVQQGANDPRGNDTNNTGTGVNLAVPGASSAIGLSLGAINGAFNLDIALSALQREGTLEIISSPRVTTQNNRPATITQGFEIPIQTVANNTVSVQYRDAALKLDVTPQITAADTVIMEIALENGFPDFSRAVNGNPSINTQKATTNVQVPDGITTVIGGVQQSRESSSDDRVPGLSRIPLLGWLFKREQESTETQELLVFITPRIIR